MTRLSEEDEMPNKYSFSGWALNDPDGVECPELDALVADVKAAFEKHGAGIGVESDYESSDKIVLVPFGKTDFDWLTDDLDDYSGGIPWLDAARDQYHRNREARHEAERKAEADRRAQDKAMREAQKRAAEQSAIEHGIVLDGKKYRLVEE
jgi:hypothetical protein